MYLHHALLQKAYYKQRSRHEDDVSGNKWYTGVTLVTDTRLCLFQQLMPIQPKEFYMPAAVGPGVPAASHIQKYSNAAVTLPQLSSSKPPYFNQPSVPASHHQPSYYPSGYSSGLPSLSHSVKITSRISAFPSLMASEHVSGKVSIQFAYQLLCILYVMLFMVCSTSAIFSLV